MLDHDTRRRRGASLLDEAGGEARDAPAGVPQPVARRKPDTIPWLLSARRSAISLPPSYVPAVIWWSFSLPSGIRIVAMNVPGATALRRGYSRR
jgi:hypothetical protein